MWSLNSKRFGLPKRNVPFGRVTWKVTNKKGCTFLRIQPFAQFMYGLVLIAFYHKNIIANPLNLGDPVNTS